MKAVTVTHTDLPGHQPIPITAGSSVAIRLLTAASYL